MKQKDKDAAAGCVGCLFLIVIAAVLYTSFCTGKDFGNLATPGSTPVVVPPSPMESTKTLLSLKIVRWRKESFGTIMIADFDINNASSHSVKDITIQFTHTAPSGTAIDSNTRTIYRLFPAQKLTGVRNFNMGFIDEQVRATRCRITDFVLVD